jgi:hypothetical protein
MKNALELMEGKLEDQLDIEEIARAAYSSPFHFQRMFHMLTGVTVAEYVKPARMPNRMASLPVLSPLPPGRFSPRSGRCREPSRACFNGSSANGFRLPGMNTPELRRWRFIRLEIRLRRITAARFLADGASSSRPSRAKKGHSWGGLSCSLTVKKPVRPSCLRPQAF